MSADDVAGVLPRQVRGIAADYQDLLSLPDVDRLIDAAARIEELERENERLRAQNIELRRVFEAARKWAGLREGCRYDSVIAALSEAAE